MGPKGDSVKAAIIQHAIASAAVVSSMGWDRVMIVIMVLLGSTTLAATGRIDAAAVIALYSAALGYVFGKAPTMGTDQRRDER